MPEQRQLTIHPDFFGSVLSRSHDLQDEDALAYLREVANTLRMMQRETIAYLIAHSTDVDPIYNTMTIVNLRTFIMIRWTYNNYRVHVLYVI